MGAKLGANEHRHRATPGHLQPFSPRPKGTSGYTQHRPGTLRKCLLSSRSRVRVAVGAQMKSQVKPPKEAAADHSWRAGKPRVHCVRSAGALGVAQPSRLASARCCGLPRWLSGRLGQTWCLLVPGLRVVRMREPGSQSAARYGPPVAFCSTATDYPERMLIILLSIGNPDSADHSADHTKALPMPSPLRLLMTV